MEEILRSPVEVGNFSHYLRRVFYIPGGWPWNFWTVNSGEKFYGTPEKNFLQIQLGKMPSNSGQMRSFFQKIISFWDPRPIRSMGMVHLLIHLPESEKTWDAGNDPIWLIYIHIYIYIFVFSNGLVEFPPNNWPETGLATLSIWLQGAVRSVHDGLNASKKAVGLVGGGSGLLWFVMGKPWICIDGTAV